LGHNIVLLGKRIDCKKNKTEKEVNLYFHN
jgi:hypothetical protein